MLQRTSVVDEVKLDILIFSSVLEIGDSTLIHALSWALAVQRETELFFGNEGDFYVYPIFTKPLPPTPFFENLTSQTELFHPVIKVNSIHVLGVSSASVVHIGSSRHIIMESRIKHVRQLLSDHRTETT